MDTGTYDVIFPDGNTAEHSVNIIAECLYSQVDNEGNQHILLDEIIDWNTMSESMDNRQVSAMEIYTSTALLNADDCASYGRMGPHHGWP
jgi:hypothetical protein